MTMTRRGLTIALFVSLAVNLFVIGALAGGLAVSGRAPGRHVVTMRSGPPPFFAAIEALPEDRQEAYRAALRQEAGVVRHQLGEAGEVRRAAWARLGEEPLDAGAVRRDLVRAQAIEAEARSVVESRVVDFAAALPPAERRAFAQALAEPPRRQRDSRRRDLPEDPPPQAPPPGPEAR